MEMTKHNLESVLKDAEKIIKQQKDRIQSIKQAYIHANAEFNIGDLIKITRPEHSYWTFKGDKGVNPESHKFAYVIDFEIDWQKNVKYVLKAQKKDSTVSKNSEHYSERDILEFVSEGHEV